MLDKLKRECGYLKTIFKKDGFETNKSNWEHVLIAIYHQVAMVLVFGWFWIDASWWIGCALGSGIYIGREVAQTQRHILNTLGYKTFISAEQDGYDLDKMATSTFRYWTKDGLYDVWFPIFFTTILAFAMGYL